MTTRTVRTGTTKTSAASSTRGKPSAKSATRRKITRPSVAKPSVAKPLEPTESIPAFDMPAKLDEATATKESIRVDFDRPPLDTSIDSEIAQMRRSLRRGLIAAQCKSERLPPHGSYGGHQPAPSQQAGVPSSAAPAATNASRRMLAPLTLANLLAVTAAMAAFCCGGTLLVGGYLGASRELVQVGMGIGLFGQVALLSAVVLTPRGA